MVNPNRFLINALNGQLTGCSRGTFIYLYIFSAIITNKCHDMCRNVQRKMFIQSTFQYILQFTEL